MEYVHVASLLIETANCYTVPLFSMSKKMQNWDNTLHTHYLINMWKSKHIKLKWIIKPLGYF